MSLPDYLICLNCETPCYDFDWKDDLITEIQCPICGNEEIDEFLTPDEFDAMVAES